MAAWVDQGLVDLIVPGCRSLDVDVQGFVELAGAGRARVSLLGRSPHVTDRAQVEKLEALVTAPAR